MDYPHDSELNFGDLGQPEEFTGFVEISTNADNFKEVQAILKELIFSNIETSDQLIQFKKIVTTIKDWHLSNSDEYLLNNYRKLTNDINKFKAYVDLYRVNSKSSSDSYEGRRMSGN